MNLNKETEEYLRAFTIKEDTLRKRAAAAGVDLTAPRFAEWQLWVGDPVLYLNELREAVEKAESRDHITEGEIATGTQ